MPDPRDDNLSIEINNSGTYIGKCKKGHDVKLIIQNQKFEVLFDLGIISLIEGYTREAVSSLIAAYERFLEFTSSIIFLKYKIPYESIIKLFDKMKLSERQLGAAIALYCVCFGEEPQLLGTKTIQFRNDVIHNGYIPTHNEVVEFGNSIVGIICPILSKIKKECTKEVQEYTMLKIMEKNKSLPASNANSTMCMASMLGLYNAEDVFDSIEIMIEKMNKMKGLTFSKFFEAERKENKYRILEAMFGKYI